MINAVGDSMYPYIHDKDKLIIEHYCGEQIYDNSIYIFRYGDNLFVKRLVNNIKEIIIVSDNKLYSPIILKQNELEEFQIIGKVVGLIRKV